jgi:hypothetical protein
MTHPHLSQQHNVPCLFVPTVPDWKHSKMNVFFGGGIVQSEMTMMKKKRKKKRQG